MPKIFINQFAEQEEGIYLKIREFRDKVLSPIADFLMQIKVTPNMLSFFGLLMIGCFSYFFHFNPGFAFFFILLNLFFDALDGVLARKIGQASFKGALLDIACDHLSFMVVMLTFIAYGFVDHFWGAFYVVNYMLWVFLTLVLRSLHVRFFPVFRSRLLIYLFFFIWLISGQNLLNPVLMIVSTYLIISNIVLFYKLQCSLS